MRIHTHKRTRTKLVESRSTLARFGTRDGMLQRGKARSKFTKAFARIPRYVRKIDYVSRRACAQSGERAVALFIPLGGSLGRSNLASLSVRPRNPADRRYRGDGFAKGAEDLHSFGSKLRLPLARIAGIVFTERGYAERTYVGRPARSGLKSPWESTRVSIKRPTLYAAVRHLYCYAQVGTCDRRPRRDSYRPAFRIPPLREICDRRHADRLADSGTMDGGGKGERWLGAAFNDDLEFWMTRFPAPLKNVPIIHLAIPGTFEIVPSSRLCP